MAELAVRGARRVEHSDHAAGAAVGDVQEIQLEPESQVRVMMRAGIACVGITPLDCSCRPSSYPKSLLLRARSDLRHDWSNHKSE